MGAWGSRDLLPAPCLSQEIPLHRSWPNGEGSCGRAGRSVSTLTLKHQVKPQFLTVVNGRGFHFCATPDCPAVYFSPDGPVLTTSNVRRPVTQKDSEHAPVCYCFGFTPYPVFS